jgi:hypothetical protein
MFFPFSILGKPNNTRFGLKFLWGYYEFSDNFNKKLSTLFSGFFLFTISLLSVIFYLLFEFE